MSGITRRQALSYFGAAGAMFATACTPVKILLGAYPEVFDDEVDLTDRVLVGFAESVLPGASVSHGELVRPLRDERFPFHSHCAYFASDLCGRAGRLCSSPQFDLLPLEQRCRVVEDGLNSDSITRQLYTGAIFLTQVAFFAGIYDDAAGCAWIDFDGRYRRRRPADLTYPNPEAFLAAEYTSSGHYH
jgi:hypothetical protein